MRMSLAGLTGMIIRATASDGAEDRVARMRMTLEGPGDPFRHPERLDPGPNPLCRVGVARLRHLAEFDLEGGAAEVIGFDLRVLGFDGVDQDADVGDAKLDQADPAEVGTRWTRRCIS
jgi:hypothetical protein